MVSGPSSLKELREEYQTRYETLERELKDKEREQNSNIDQIESRGRRQTLTATEKTEATLAQEREKGENAVRDVSRKSHTEIRDTYQKGENERIRLKSFYDQEVRDTEHAGKRKLKEIESKQMLSKSMLDSQAKTENALALQAAEHERALTEAEKTERIEKLKLASFKEVSDAKLHAEQERTQLHDKFTTDHARILTEQQAILSKLSGRTSEILKDMRTGYSDSLSALNDQSKDPFYHLAHYETKLFNSDEEFVVVANVPVYEQEKFRLAIQGNYAVLSGARNSEDRLEKGKGEELRTSSYQTFSESFKLNHPINARGISKEVIGTNVVFRIPKMRPDLDNPQFTVAKKEVPELVMPRPPIFPKRIREKS